MSLFNPGKASVVIDGQFGSTGKGLAAAYQSLRNTDVDWHMVICTTNAAPNAGHTTVMPDGTKFVTFHMPTVGVIHKNTTIYLNAGAIIDIPLMIEEMGTLGVDPHRVFVHPNAAVITDEDKEYERNKSSGVTAIASTQKGVGRALARKVMREGATAKQYHQVLSAIGVRVAPIDLNEEMRTGHAVCIETPQGMSLSLNNGFYPHCTSREVSVAQSLSDAGVSPRRLGEVLATFRTYPIRVGNIVEDGKLLGYSGDGYDDQSELAWENFPGVVPEKTTVTQRVRRIFTFSRKQYMDAMHRLSPTKVHLGFCDYIKNLSEFDSLMTKMRECHTLTSNYPEIYCSFGPSVNDVVSITEAWRRIPND
jgi:adenylosuccinate synthase